MDASLIFLWCGTAALAAVACWLWRPLARRMGFIDAPSHRSLHETPMVRSGGVVMVLAVAVGLAVHGDVGNGSLMLALALAAGLALVSALDDRKPLPVLPRLGSHLLACILFVLLALSPPDWPLPVLAAAAIFAILALAWMTNLYNFMDGSDGLAGGQGAIGFAALGLLALIAQAPQVAVIAFAVSGACAGFLVWNFPPARLFLGDAGAIPLGFLAGALSFWLLLETRLTVWLLLLPFAPFWMDASYTLLRRMWQGARFWQPHKEHAYQHLVQTGFGHRGTALAAYGLMLGCGLVALAGATLSADPWVHFTIFLVNFGTLVGVGVIIFLRKLSDFTDS